MAAGDDFAAVAEALRAILEQCRGPLVTTADSPTGFSLSVPGLEGTPRGYVAGTRVGKRYVSYYLMPVYARPSLVNGLSPELRRRMQGKACFNFTRVDDQLFAELADLTARGIAGYLADGLPERVAAGRGSADSAQGAGRVPAGSNRSR